MTMDDKICKYVFQLRRVGAAATCKGMSDVYRVQPGKTLIGRHIAAVDIYLNSAVHKQLISRQHAELHIEHKQNKPVVHLLDKSTNGTFVNDVKIQGKVNLKEGDVLTFGHVQGIQILPGMLRRQPGSEFRFMLEKIHCENVPPENSGIFSDEVCSVLQGGACEAKENLCLDQAVSAHSSGKHMTLSSKQYTADTRQDAHLPSEVQALNKDSLQRNSNSASHKEQTEKCDRVSGNTKYPLVTTGQLQPLPCSKASPVIQSSPKDEAAASDGKQKPTDNEPALMFTCSSGKEVGMCSKDADELLSMDTDAALQQLSSEITAKVAHFDESDSESGLEEMLPTSQKRLQGDWTQDKCQASHTSEESHTGSGSASPAELGASTGHLQFRKRGTTSGNKKRRKRKHTFPKQRNKVALVQIAKSFTQVTQPERCDSYECTHPTDSTVDWVQCDGCDKWYHVVCVGCDYETVKEDSAAFHCGCTRS